MKLFKKKFAWALCYTLVLAAFTLYVLLDTFVIERAYVLAPSDTAGLKMQSAGTAAVNASAGSSSENSGVFTDSVVVTDMSYSDPNISITITKYREHGTDIYAADIYVASVDYLKTAFADNTFGKNVTDKTSAIAKAHDAILAVNGDFYGAQTKGYVVRNGTLYRATMSDPLKQDMVIYGDGTLGIIAEGEIPASKLIDSGALQVLSFGPELITNGEIAVGLDTEVRGIQTNSNPRTAIGMIDKLHYMLVVSDGRTSASTGLSLFQLAAFMQTFGVTTAYNLDGGGSSTLFFNGKVLNTPTTNGKVISERSVSDILYIGY